MVSSTSHYSTENTVLSNQRPLNAGVYVPTVAFFDKNDDEDVDIDTTEKHAARLAQTGIAGIVTHGSNGEAVYLERDERMNITKATRRALSSAGHEDMPIIVGCGAQSTRETIRLCKDAHVSGGDYALILPPAYYKPLLSADNLLGHFRAVADASPIPLLIYNFPAAVGGLDLTSDQIIALSQHSNIVGVKLTCGNTGKLGRIAFGVTNQDFVTLGGSADFILPTLVSGGQGTIAGLANIAPRCCVRIMELYWQGNLAQAQRLQAIVAEADWVAIQGGFVAVKAGLQLCENYGGIPRRPCTPPDRAATVKLSEQLREVIRLEQGLAREMGA